MNKKHNNKSKHLFALNQKFCVVLLPPSGRNAPEYLRITQPVGYGMLFCKLLV